MPAVEMPAHLDDDVFAREGARHAQRHERGLGAGGDELDLAAGAGARDQLLDQLAPLDFQGVAGTVVAALLDLLGYGLGDLRVAVAQNEGAVTAEEVDVLVAVHIPLAPPPALVHVNP